MTSEHSYDLREPRKRSKIIEQSHILCKSKTQQVFLFEYDSKRDLTVYPEYKIHNYLDNSYNFYGKHH
ncbi:Hypothetical predicted protein [Octopus vulgaris]|uniref:Uncharacterized protein n=1 Tax=Octopus vulgaris TaxID=6645 RepID=A0AA36B8T2_OCTVU|nr:Hypothetical predicted protein [Octopus vulgaris]